MPPEEPGEKSGQIVDQPARRNVVEIGHAPHRLPEIPRQRHFAVVIVVLPDGRPPLAAGQQSRRHSKQNRQRHPEVPSGRTAERPHQRAPGDSGQNPRQQGECPVKPRIKPAAIAALQRRRKQVEKKQWNSELGNEKEPVTVARRRIFPHQPEHQDKHRGVEDSGQRAPPLPDPLLEELDPGQRKGEEQQSAITALRRAGGRGGVPCRNHRQRRKKKQYRQRRKRGQRLQRRYRDRLPRHDETGQQRIEAEPGDDRRVSRLRREAPVPAAEQKRRRTEDRQSDIFSGVLETFRHAGDAEETADEVPVRFGFQLHRPPVEPARRQRQHPRLPERRKAHLRRKRTTRLLAPGCGTEPEQTGYQQHQRQRNKHHDLLRSLHG